MRKNSRLKNPGQWDEYFRKLYENDWLFKLINEWTTFGYAIDLHTFTSICFNCRRYWGNCICNLPKTTKEVKQEIN